MEIDLCDIFDNVPELTIEKGTSNITNEKYFMIYSDSLYLATIYLSDDNIASYIDISNISYITKRNYYFLKIAAGLIGCKIKG